MSEGHFWGDNFYQHPPLTDEMVAVAQEGLGKVLPPGYLRLLTIQNGGYTAGFGFPTSRPTSWAEDHVPLEWLSGIVTDPEIRSPFNLLESPRTTDLWELPADQLLLTGDGHWWITLDYRAAVIPVVSWIDTECGEDWILAKTIDDFVAGLRPMADFVADDRNGVGST